MCTAASRIYVQEGIYDRFVQAFAAAASAIKLGDTFGDGSDQGPLVSEAQLKVCVCHPESELNDNRELSTARSRLY